MKEFNLLREPWILAMNNYGKTEELSILGVFERAHDFKALAGELPTQDAAVLRLLLAIMHTVFARYEIDGSSVDAEAEEEEKIDRALKLWGELYTKGRFPYEVIEKYLLSYEDRFYLFHPERPFYQVAELGHEKATEYGAKKLIGEISESENKSRLFPFRTREGKERLSYSEGARWLLYTNAFDDTSSKPVKQNKDDKFSSVGAGWLGKLGLIIAAGSTLFETLMLNFVLLPDGENKLWDEGKPIWELEKVKKEQRISINKPHNPAELLTLQSRRIFLKREKDKIMGYKLLGGDFFEKENMFSEQMTLWSGNAKKDTPEYAPQRHSYSKQLWRNFSALLAASDDSASKRRPGVVSWLARLRSDGVIPSVIFRFQTPSIAFGDKDFFVDDTFSDDLSFNSNLLSKLGEGWIVRIEGEIGITEKLVWKAGLLAQNIAKASGISENTRLKRIAETAQEQGYYRLDAPFRRWLENIDPEKDDMDECCGKWFETAKTAVRKLGGELADSAGKPALIGREVKDSKGNPTHISAPQAYNWFLIHTKDRETLLQGVKDGQPNSRGKKGGKLKSS